MKAINNSNSIGIRNNFWLKIYKDTSFPSFVVLILLIFANAILQPNFFSIGVLRTNFMTFTPLVLVTIAQSIIIISGSIDFSVGASLSFFTCMTAYFMTDQNVVVVLLIGFMAVILLNGLLNGVLIGKLKLQPLITTYSTQAIMLGLAMFIMPVAGGYVPRFFYKFYSSNILKFIPVPILILAIGIAIWFFISKTSIYRYIYAIGGFEEGAYASGIKVTIVKILSHVIASIFVGLAGICILMLSATGEWRSGSPYLINSIAAAIIGGISLRGGKGNIWGAICGALILGLLNNIIFFAKVSSYYQIFAKGMIIFLALSVASLPKLFEEKYKFL